MRRLGERYASSCRIIANIHAILQPDLQAPIGVPVQELLVAEERASRRHRWRMQMPLVDIQLIKGVFDDDQKRTMIEKVTDTMVAIEGEAMRGVTWVRIQEIASGEWAHRRPTADRRRCEGDPGPGRIIERMSLWKICLASWSKAALFSPSMSCSSRTFTRCRQFEASSSRLKRDVKKWEPVFHLKSRDDKQL